MSLRPTTWLAAAAVLLSACGDPPSEPVRPGRMRLEFRAAHDAPPPAERRVVTRFDVLATRPDWTVRASSSSLGQLSEDDGADGRSVLTLVGGVGPQQLLEVRIPGRIDPRAINRVAVTAVIPGHRVLNAALLRGGDPVVEGYALAVDGGRELRTIVVDLELSDEVETCGHVAVTITGAGEPVQLAAVELLREPGLVALPRPEEPELVDISGTWVRAFGLSSQRPLETTLRVRKGAVLTFEFGLPKRVRIPDSASQLRVVISGPGNRVAQHNLSFEYEEVVVYREDDPSRRRKARVQQKVAKIKNPEQREMRKGRMARKRGQAPPDAAFGEAPLDEEEDQGPERVRVVDIPKGLVDEWLRAWIPLDDFVGQEVVVRLELVEERVAESVCAVGVPSAVVPDAQAPLVLLITSDAHRADHLAAGRAGARLDTPWLDKLAERGAVFENCWAPANGMFAANVAVLTGTSPRDTGLLRDGQALGRDVATLARRFREAGWTTLASVSHGALAPEISGLGQGFDQMSAPRLADRDAEGSLQHLLAAVDRARGVPVFGWMHLRDADAPYEPPPSFRRAHYDAKADPYDRELPRPDRRAPDWIEGVRDLGYVEALYASEVTWIDRKMKEVVEHPRLSRATLAFAGTHGESLWSFDHERLTPETLHVPLLIAGPGVPQGAHVSKPVQLLDLGRTLLDLAGLGEAEFPGTTLLDREADVAPRFALSASGVSAAVESNGVLLVMRLGPDREVRHISRLYDVVADPLGHRDLSEERPDEALELRRLLVEWLRTAPRGGAEQRAEIRDERVDRQMESLGIDLGATAARATPWIAPDCPCEQCAAPGEAPE